jgi:hypothetical protein
MEDYPRAILSRQYWDPSSNAFHTLLGKDGFRSRLQINLSQKHVYEGGDTIIFIELGLKADENAVEPGTGPRDLTPWAALFSVYRDGRGSMICSDNRWSYVQGGGVIFNEDSRTPLPTLYKAPWGKFNGSSTCSVSTKVDTKRIWNL